MGHLVNHLRVYLFDDAIGLGRQEGIDLCVEFNEVLFGPLNFQADRSQPFIGIHGIRS